MERGGDEYITIEVMVGGVTKVRVDKGVPVHELLEQCRTGGMVRIRVCITPDINGDIMVGSPDVLHYEGEGSQGNNPLMLLTSGRHVDPYVGGWGLPRDVQKERENSWGSGSKHCYIGI